MRTRRPFALARLFLFICCAPFALPAFAATPGFTLTASNVNMSDMGSGVSNFTLTSVDGFAGQVSVVCTGPNPLLVPDLVLPNCAAIEEFLVPAGGSASGTMNFNPPSSVQSAAKPHALPRNPGSPIHTPLKFCALVAALLGFSCTKKLNRWFAMVLVCAVSLTGLCGTTGCLGRGGLAMTPGTYSYVISASSPTITTAVSATISVTIHE
ncbi:MAG: hypothetical protein ABSF70_03015 [Terracidiphilus sp.]